MTVKLSFNCPIYFGNIPYMNNSAQTKFPLLGKITEGYFNFRDVAAAPLDSTDKGIRVMFIHTNQNPLILFLKAISWITVITPLFMLIGKIIFRYLNDFVVTNEPASQEISDSILNNLNASPVDPKDAFGEDDTFVAATNCTIYGYYLRDSLGRLWRLFEFKKKEGLISYQLGLLTFMSVTRNRVINLTKDRGSEIATLIKNNRFEIKNSEA